MIVSDTALAWAAGFFDGEGSVGVYKNGNNKRLTASVSQNDRETLWRFHALLGGRFSGPYRADGGRAGHYRLAFAGEAVVALYRALRPYLVLKGKAFEQAIDDFRLYKAAFVPRKPGPKHVSRR